MAFLILALLAYSLAKIINFFLAKKVQKGKHEQTKAIPLCRPPHVRALQRADFEAVLSDDKVPLLAFGNEGELIIISSDKYSSACGSFDATQGFYIAWCIETAFCSRYGLKIAFAISKQ